MFVTVFVRMLVSITMAVLMLVVMLVCVLLLVIKHLNVRLKLFHYSLYLTFYARNITLFVPYNKLFADKIHIR